MRIVPAPYRARPPVQLPRSSYHLIVFATSKESVVLSGTVAKALKDVPESAQVVVAGSGFTSEGLDLLRKRQAAILTISDFDWTDDSYQKVGQAKRLPRYDA